MDYLSVTTCYRYINQAIEESRATIVTACVDNFNIFQPVSIQQDLLLSAYITNVGKSTLEVSVDVEQGDLETSQFKLHGNAYFLMAARDKLEAGKSYKVPQLSTEGEDDIKNAVYRQ